MPRQKLFPRIRAVPSSEARVVPGTEPAQSPGSAVGTCWKPVPSRVGPAAPRAPPCDPSAGLLCDDRDLRFGLVLLTGQEAASNHFGSRQRINHPLQRSTAREGLLPVAEEGKASAARLTDRKGKQRPTRQPRLYNLSWDTARFFYLSDFLIGSQLPGGI